MSEVFHFDFFQIPHVGVEKVAKERDNDTHVRSPETITYMGKSYYVNPKIRRHPNMVMSNFGALFVGSKMSHDYTRTDLGFKFKGEFEDVNLWSADTGVGQNVSLRGVNVVHNPLVWGSTVKYTRDDQFIRMSMSKDNGAQIDRPAFDVMDEKERTAAGIIATSNSSIKNWPSEGWRSFGGKYDFLPYSGGHLK